MGTTTHKDNISSSTPNILSMPPESQPDATFKQAEAAARKSFSLWQSWLEELENINIGKDIKFKTTIASYANKSAMQDIENYLKALLKQYPNLAGVITEFYDDLKRMHNLAANIVSVCLPNQDALKQLELIANLLKANNFDLKCIGRLSKNGQLLSQYAKEFGFKFSDANLSNDNLFSFANFGVQWIAKYPDHLKRALEIAPTERKQEVQRMFENFSDKKDGKGNTISKGIVSEANEALSHENKSAAAQTKTPTAEEQNQAKIKNIVDKIKPLRGGLLSRLGLARFFSRASSQEINKDMNILKDRLKLFAEGALSPNYVGSLSEDMHRLLQKMEIKIANNIGMIVGGGSVNDNDFKILLDNLKHILALRKTLNYNDTESFKTISNIHEILKESLKTPKLSASKFAAQVENCVSELSKYKDNKVEAEKNDEQPIIVTQQSTCLADISKDFAALAEKYKKLSEGLKDLSARKEYVTGMDKLFQEVDRLMRNYPNAAEQLGNYKQFLLAKCPELKDIIKHRAEELVKTAPAPLVIPPPLVASHDNKSAGQQDLPARRAT